MTPAEAREPYVSVIIVSWNALALLREFLPSVIATDYPQLEIILADNASTDGSPEWVAETFPKVKVLKHDRNYAFCRGNNLAIRQSRGEFVVLLNNDVRVPAGWLRPLVKRAQANQRIAAVQPKILQHAAPGMFEYAGAAGGYLDRWGYPFARGRVLFRTEKDERQYDQPVDIDWATGAAVLLRRSALEEVGLLDERFYMHMEEIDLCWRLRRAGYRVVFEPASRVYHVGAASLAGDSPRKAYFNFRNNLLTLYKNLPPHRWRIVYSVRAVLDGIAAGRALALFRFREALAILRAHRDFHKMKPEYRGQRPDTKVPGMTYRGSILFDYYFLRKRRFSDLPSHRFVSRAEIAEAAEARRPG